MEERAGEMTCLAGREWTTATYGNICEVNRRPQGRAALICATFVKPPALPEVADTLPLPFWRKYCLESGKFVVFP